MNLALDSLYGATPVPVAIALCEGLLAERLNDRQNRCAYSAPAGLRLTSAVKHRMNTPMRWIDPDSNATCAITLAQMRRQKVRLSLT